MNGFEGSFLGQSDRIDANSVLECGVCWWVYDPALGDDTWQVAAGTAFAELPDHWRCPGCDSPRQQFMVLERGEEHLPGQRRVAARTPDRALRQQHQMLLDAYSAAASRMRQLPVYNDKLDIQVIGLQRWQEGLLCVAATPWCMNILLLPGEEAASRMEGTTRDVEFPSGTYSFIAGELTGVGQIESCSLFSPMEQFDDPDVVSAVARHALMELLTAPGAPAISRREFFRGEGQIRDPAQPR